MLSLASPASCSTARGEPPRERVLTGAVAADGALWVSDDVGGVIWRVASAHAD